MIGSFQQFGRTMTQIGLSLRPPAPGTSIAIRVALLSLEGVQNVIVEGPMDRRIVPEGHIRITVHGGFADQIADRLLDVLPATVAIDGFVEVVASSGVTYRFDHVEPSIIPAPPPRPWYRRLWAWMRGGAG